MLRVMLTSFVALAVTSGNLTAQARDDEILGIRHHKLVQRACDRAHCRPLPPCRLLCSVVCPDRYSCAPLYGAYGPYGGINYWSAYTPGGWKW
jgi:hypothetical protein